MVSTRAQNKLARLAANDELPVYKCCYSMCPHEECHKSPIITGKTQQKSCTSFGAILYLDNTKGLVSLAQRLALLGKDQQKLEHMSKEYLLEDTRAPSSPPASKTSWTGPQSGEPG